MMNLANLSWSGVPAGARSAAAALGGAAGAFAAMHLISGGDATHLQAAFDQISDGVTKIVAGVTALSTILLPLYATLRNSMAQKKDDVLADPKATASIAAEPKVVTAMVNNPVAAAAAASDPKMVAAVADNPKVAVIHADPDLAQAAPSNKVIAP